MKFFNKVFGFSLLLIFFVWFADFIFEILLLYKVTSFEGFLNEKIFEHSLFYKLISTICILVFAFYLDKSLKKVKAREESLILQHKQAKNLLEELKQKYEQTQSELQQINQNFLQEVQQNKLYQQILEESERKHRSLLDQLPVGVYRSTIDGKILYANFALAKILGFDKVEDLLQASALDFYFSSEDRKKVLEIQSQGTDVFIQTEVALKRIDGKELYVYDYGRRIVDPKTNFSYFDGILLDITETIKNRVALEESEKRFRTLFEEITDLYIYFDSDWIIKEVSPSARYILGYDSKELIGKSLNHLVESSVLLHSILQENKSIYKNLLLHFLCSDSSLKFLSGDIITHFDKNNNVVGYTGVLRDVTSDIEFKNFMNALVGISRAYDEHSSFYTIGGEIFRSYTYILTARNFVFGIVRPNSNKIEICYHFDRYGIAFEDINFDDDYNPLVRTAKEGILKYFFEEDIKESKFPKVPKVFLGIPLITNEKLVGVVGFYSYTNEKKFNNINVYHLLTLSEHISKNLYRKLIEEQLNFQIQLFETLIEAIPYPICYQNTHTSQILICNTHFAKLFKSEKEKIIGTSLHLLFDSEVIETINRLNTEIEKFHSIQVFDYIFKDDDIGKQIYFNWIRSFLQIEAINHRGVVEILIDITERAKYEKEISEALEFNRNILELIPSGIAVIDSENKIRVWNRQAEVITGFMQEELIGINFLTSEEWEKFALAELLSFDVDVSGPTEIEFITQKNEKKILRKNFFRFLDDKSLNLKAIISFEDVTESVNSRERLRFLAEAHSRLTNISSFIASIKDKETLLNIVLPLLTQLTKSEGSAFLEISENDGDYCADQLFKNCDGSIEKIMVNIKLENLPNFMFTNVMQGQETVEIEFNDEKIIGEEFRFLFNKRALFAFVGSGRRPFGFIIAYGKSSQFLQEEKTLIDQISLLLATNLERIIYEDEINSALIKEFQLNELRSNFISMISHQYRTPLQSIVLSADILQKYFDKLTSKERTAQLERIQRATKDMSAMIDNIIIYNKFSGDYPKHLESVSGKQFFESLLQDFQLYYKGKVNINFEIFGSIDKIVLEPQVINLVFQNLISNSVKYSKEHSEVHIVVRFDSKSIQIEVKDNGIGIPEGEIEKIFDPFYRGKNVKTLPGTGLGLTIVKKAVQNLGGNVFVSSQLNKGTTFTVEIPITE